MSAWPNDVRHVVDGEPVDAATTGRPTRTLEGQTRYLKERLAGIEAGDAVVLGDRTVAPETLVGSPVYYDPVNDRFDLALAAIDTDANGYAAGAASADVIGVVLRKSSSTLADICIVGAVSLDLSAVVEGDVLPGRYYLSGRTPGVLVRSRPGVGVAVLVADGAGTVYVNPQPRDIADSHLHFKVDLYTQPAGEMRQRQPDERYEIDDPDSNDPGWLPADHAVFEGLAPAGAKFGYNLEQHPELADLWPPLPTEAASLVLFRAEDSGVGVELPLGSQGLAIIDAAGLWWMSDCYGQAPWEANLNTNPSASSSLVSSSAGDSCPAPGRKLSVYFSKVRYAIDKSTVTSLTAADPNGPIQFVDCYGNPATTGALVARYLPGLAIAKDDEVGSLAVKGINEAGKLVRGRVTEGVRSKTTRLAVTGTASRTVDSKTYAQGLIELDLDSDPGERLLNAQVVRLDGARDRYDEEVMTLGLPAGVTSGLRLKFKVPPEAALPGDPQITLRLTLIGKSAGTLPALSLAYRRVPAGSVVPAAVPSTDTALADTSTVALGADEYVTLDAEAFDIAAEDTVFVSITRGDSDGYGGEVGVLDAVAVLTAG